MQLKRCSALFAALALAAAADAGAAGAARTFVSTAGSDANASVNCGATTPCRTFATALSVLSAGGELIVLTSGGYGPVSIAQSASIKAAPGVYAGITVASGDGVSISGGNVRVLLSGLSINGQGGVHGINISATGTSSVTIQNCAISGMSGDGILDTGSQPLSSPATAPIALSVLHTRIDGNGGVGVNINSGGGAIVALLDDLTITDNAGGGVLMQDGALVDLIDSHIMLNGAIGVQVLATGITQGIDTTLQITGSQVINLGTAALSFVNENTTHAVNGQIYRTAISGGPGFGITASAVGTSCCNTGGTLIDLSDSRINASNTAINLGAGAGSALVFNTHGNNTLDAGVPNGTLNNIGLK